MSGIPNSVEEVTLPQDSINRTITETGLQGSKESFPGFFLAAIQMFFAFASFFGNVLVNRVIHILPDSRLRTTTKLLMSYVSLSHCIIDVVLVGRLFNMPCLLVLLGGFSSGFNVLCGILFLAFEAFILVKKPHGHTSFVSVKICIFQILFSCLMTMGFSLAMYLTQKVPDDVSFCYMTNGIFNPWVLGLPTCLLVAMIICATVIQISTLRTLRKTSPTGTNTAASPPSNLQAMLNPTVHPPSALQQISSNVQAMPNCTVDPPHVPQERSSNVQVMPNCTVNPPHITDETSSNVQVMPNCTVNPPHITDEMSSNVQVMPNCTVDPPHIPDEMSSNVQVVPNCTVDPPHIPHETSSNLQVMPNCTVDPPHVPHETSSNVQVMPNCTVNPPHVPHETSSNVQVVPNCTVDPPHVPHETSSNVQVVPNPAVNPPHVSQAIRRNMTRLHKLTVILFFSLLCFIICWLPLCLAFIVFSFLEMLVIEVSEEGKLITALSSLAMLNGCLHVAVYVVMSTQIRQALKKYVKSWWCFG